MRARLRIVAGILALGAHMLDTGTLVAQSQDVATPAAMKRIVATRVATPPRIDGRLDAAEWAGATFVEDFTQKDPIEGAPPSERTELAIVYDDDALYVGARLHRRDPSRIHRAITRRDHVGNTERLIVSLDTYRDRRTAWSFSVTAAGGLTDYYHSSDDEFDREFSFNPVWEAETSIDESGWSVEMRIPFSQLRFNDVDEQVWGINIDRWVPDLNEDIYWVMVPKQERGWASRFGELVGIAGIRPSTRLELLPYVAGDARLPDERDDRDPFDETFGGRAGLDLKMGLGPNLTLDATVNPDFGQVEADPAQVNLTDFETTFEERRPFFVEGSQLLRGSGPNYFYSRRIGAPPHGHAFGMYADVPDNSTILAATKLTGRLANGLSLGALAAVTERERARTFFVDAGRDRYDTVEVEPLSAYGVVRAQQEFSEGQSTLGAIGTIVRRDLDEGSELAQILPGSAVAGGVDYALRFGGDAWALEASAGGSHVAGDTAAMLRLQRSSARYFGRPDADYVEIDPTRRSLTGYVLNLNVSKTTGRWRGNIGASAESPELELNDLGRLGTADDIDAWVGASYHETEPGPLLREYRLGLSTDAGWNYGGVNTYQSFNADVSLTLRSFWSISAWSGLGLPRRSDNLSRGGPLMGTALGGWGGLSISSPYTDKVRAWFSAGGSGNAIGGWNLELDGGLSAELSEQWSLRLEPHFSRGQTPRQYVATLDGGGAATYGRRYVFARIDETYLSAQLRISYIITPHLSLDLYAEPFVGAGRYHDYGELPEPGTTEIRRYGQSGGSVSGPAHGEIFIEDGGDDFTVPAGDFTYLSFRSNMVLRWEWLPGSTAYLVWQRSSQDFGPRAEPVRPAHLWESIGAAGEQVIAIKVAYWLPID